MMTQSVVRDGRTTSRTTSIHDTAHYCAVALHLQASVSGVHIFTPGVLVARRPSGSRQRRKLNPTASVCRPTTPKKRKMVARLTSRRDCLFPQQVTNRENYSSSTAGIITRTQTNTDKPDKCGAIASIRRCAFCVCVTFLLYYMYNSSILLISYFST